MTNPPKVRVRYSKTLRVRMTENQYLGILALCQKNNTTPSEITRQMWGALQKDEDRHTAVYLTPNEEPS